MFFGWRTVCEEKPSFDVAEMLASGDYLWKTAVFSVEATHESKLSILNQPRVYAAVQRIACSWSAPNADAVLRAEYTRDCRRSASTHAVMEKDRRTC